MGGSSFLTKSVLAKYQGKFLSYLESARKCQIFVKNEGAIVQIPWSEY